MQLPPTILSLDRHGQKEKIKDLDRKVTDSPEVPQKSSKSADSVKSSTKENVLPQTLQESELSSSENGTGTDSDGDSESVKGDVIIAEEDVKAVIDNSETKPERPSKRLVLRPPRTLETTLFDRLEKMHGRGIKRLLNIQYRCVVQNLDRFTQFWLGCMARCASFLPRPSTRPS